MSGPVAAEPAPPSNGRAIALDGTVPGRPACAACHMADGAGQPDVGIPRLAGLTSSYLASQLGYFASGARRNAAMSPYAARLSPTERQAVANYFASLPLPPPAQELATTPAQIARGKYLFAHGDERTGALSCADCHGPTAAGVADFSPRLAGQSQSYLESELLEWRSGEPRDPKGAYMRAVAGRLTKSDINALAAYLAALTNEEITK